MRKSAVVLLALAAVSVGAFACSSDDEATRPDEGVRGEEPPATNYGALERKVFNMVAAQMYLPLFWIADTDKDDKIDPDETAIIHGLDEGEWSRWLKDGAFTPDFEAAYGAMVSHRQAGAKSDLADEAESRRRAKVLEELNQGRPTLILTDVSGASEEDRAIVGHIVKAAAIIEKLHARQTGTLEMQAKVSTGDAASRALFFRNQGPWCVAPKTETDPDCNALPLRPAKVSGLYPAAIQSDESFCTMLEARADEAELLSPFVVVRDGGNGELKAVPYTVEFKDDMEAVAKELEAAANAITSPSEAAFKAYLLADAESFRTNNWEPADEAWSKMNAENSKWFLRLAPDEVYFEPCSRKAGFHVSFAHINQGSLEWQRKLEPVKADMEKALAELAGPPYVARDVAFHLPDFIDIILNAGDSRSPHGATIGQSLPNWGPVANEGRGRTVAMTNLYTDPDSQVARRLQAESVLCAGAMSHFSDDDSLSVMSTVLHEAAHNLGPAHEYKVDGKTDDQVFGGPLASTFEELKSQTAALYFADWLAERKIIDDEAATGAHVRDLTWAFGHISRGMYTATNKPKAYSQLASIQVGFLSKEGAVSWKAGEKAANGTDKGCMDIDVAKLKPGIHKLAKEVLRIKGAGDADGAKKLIADFVDAKDDWSATRDVIQERWLRTEKASFVYAIKK